MTGVVSETELVIGVVSETETVTGVVLDTHTEPLAVSLRLRRTF